MYLCKKSYNYIKDNTISQTFPLGLTKSSFGFRLKLPKSPLVSAWSQPLTPTTQARWPNQQVRETKSSPEVSLAVTFNSWRCRTTLTVLLMYGRLTVALSMVTWWPELIIYMILQYNCKILYASREISIYSNVIMNFVHTSKSDCILIVVSPTRSV